MLSSRPGALLRSPLFDLHLAANARLIPFGGWEMPVQYGGILDEHLAVREGAGLFDLSHMGRLYFTGPVGRSLLQSLSCNDLNALKPGRAQYGLLCNQHGGILDDTVAYDLGDRVLLVVNASNRTRVLRWVEQHAFGRDAPISDATEQTAMIGLQGPLAAAVLGPLTDADLGGLRYYASVQARVGGFRALIARTGYTGEDGFELIVSDGDGPPLWSQLASVSQPVQPALCGLGARDTLRLEAGMPLYGHELTEATNPFEAGLGRVVKLEKGDFVGRQALRALAASPPTRRLVGLQMVGQALPRQGCVISAANQPVGEVTSGTFSPSLKRGIGIGYLAAQLTEPGTHVDIIVRNQPRPALVVALPHYAHRTVSRRAP